MRNPAANGGAARNVTFGLDKTKCSPLAAPLQAPPPSPWRGSVRLRVQRKAARLRRLGDRAVYEEFAQIARDHDLGGDVADLLDRFAQLNPEVVYALGVDRLPPPPHHLVADDQP